MSHVVPSVLFVCLGNICRSPTAEAVFRHKVKEAGMDVSIDSAGTHGYHIGKAPDSRSQQAGQARGYSFAGLACRKVDSSDFEKFDYILAMDNDNYNNLIKKSDAQYHHKVHMMMDFAPAYDNEVPDPYYGGAQGFELVLDMIEAASDGLIKDIRRKF